jgi:Cu(I)/Ag(I) efflux system protein CusF
MTKLFFYSIAFALLLPSSAAPAQQKMDEMKGMDMGEKPAATAQRTHTAVGTVKKVDAKVGTVTLAHGPVKSMNWPAMTMGFKVTDKSLFDKLAEGKKVEFEFTQVEKDYVISTVK